MSTRAELEPLPEHFLLFYTQLKARRQRRRGLKVPAISEIQEWNREQYIEWLLAHEND